MSNSQLLQTLADCNGTSVMDLLEGLTFDSLEYEGGICRNCEAVLDAEPDATQNWCPECNSQGVVSALALAGLI